MAGFRSEYPQEQHENPMEILLTPTSGMVMQRYFISFAVLLPA